MIEELAKRIEAKANRKKLKGVLQFNLDDTFGFIEITPDKVTVTGGKNDKADCTITCPVLLLQDIIAGREDPQMAFYDGRLGLKGAQPLALELFLRVLR